MVSPVEDNVNVVAKPPEAAETPAPAATATPPATAAPATAGNTPATAATKGKPTTAAPAKDPKKPDAAAPAQPNAPAASEKKEGMDLSTMTQEQKQQLFAGALLAIADMLGLGDTFRKIFKGAGIDIDSLVQKPSAGDAKPGTPTTDAKPGTPAPDAKPAAPAVSAEHKALAEKIGAELGKNPTPEALKAAMEQIVDSVYKPDTFESFLAKQAIEQAIKDAKQGGLNMADQANLVRSIEKAVAVANIELPEFDIKIEAPNITVAPKPIDFSNLKVATPVAPVAGFSPVSLDTPDQQPPVKGLEAEMARAMASMSPEQKARLDSLGAQLRANPSEENFQAMSAETVKALGGPDSILGKKAIEILNSQDMKELREYAFVRSSPKALEAEMARVMASMSPEQKARLDALSAKSREVPSEENLKALAAETVKALGGPDSILGKKAIEIFGLPGAQGNKPIDPSTISPLKPGELNQWTRLPDENAATAKEMTDISYDGSRKATLSGEFGKSTDPASAIAVADPKVDPNAAPDAAPGLDQRYANYNKAAALSV
jgi:hypothetical protein